MDDNNNDIPDSLDKDVRPLFIYHLKLISGDAVIGKSFDTATMISEYGAVMLHEVMQVKKIFLQTENGLNEALTITPWMEAADLFIPLSIPLSAIMAIAPLKQDMIISYQKTIVQTAMKEMMAQKAIEEARNKLDDGKPTAVNAREFAEQLIALAESGRDPDRVTPEAIMEDTMTGELDDVLDDLEEEELEKTFQEEEADEPSYVKNGTTYH